MRQGDGGGGEEAQGTGLLHAAAAALPAADAASWLVSPQEHTADLKQRIEAQFSDLHQFLYQEEKLLQVKLKTEERRELIRLDEHKALLCVEISRLQRAVQEIEEKLKEQDPFALLRVSPRTVNKAHLEAIERTVSQLRGD